MSDSLLFSYSKERLKWALVVVVVVAAEAVLLEASLY
jgi:hypothetical protein